MEHCKWMVCKFLLRYRLGLRGGGRDRAPRSSSKSGSGKSKTNKDENLSKQRAAPTHKASKWSPRECFGLTRLWKQFSFRNSVPTKTVTEVDDDDDGDAVRLSQGTGGRKLDNVDNACATQMDTFGAVVRLVLGAYLVVRKDITIFISSFMSA